MIGNDKLQEQSDVLIEDFVNTWQKVHPSQSINAQLFQNYLIESQEDDSQRLPFQNEENNEIYEYNKSLNHNISNSNVRNNTNQKHHLSVSPNNNKNINDISKEVLNSSFPLSNQNMVLNEENKKQRSQSISLFTSFGNDNKQFQKQELVEEQNEQNCNKVLSQSANLNNENQINPQNQRIHSKSNPQCSQFGNQLSQIQADQIQQRDSNLKIHKQAENEKFMSQQAAQQKKQIQNKQNQIKSLSPPINPQISEFKIKQKIRNRSNSSQSIRKNSDNYLNKSVPQNYENKNQNENNLRGKSQSASQFSQVGNKLKSAQQGEQNVSHTQNRVNRHSINLQAQQNVDADGNKDEMEIIESTILEGDGNNQNVQNIKQSNQDSRYQKKQEQDNNENDLKFNECMDDEDITLSNSQDLTKNNHQETSKQAQHLNSIQEFEKYHSNQEIQQSDNESENEEIEGIKITKINRIQFNKYQVSIEFENGTQNPHQSIDTKDNDKKQDIIQIEKQESRCLSPYSLIKRKNVNKSQQKSSKSIISPKKTPIKKAISNKLDSEDNQISPLKVIQEQKQSRLKLEHEQWKQNLMRKWVEHSQDKDYAKQKEECTFKPNLSLSKKFNDKLTMNQKNDPDIGSRLYNYYSTPMKIDLIHQNSIEKESQQNGESILKTAAHTSFKHSLTKIPLSYSTISPIKFSAIQNTYTQNSIKDQIEQFPSESFDQTVDRMKKQFEEVQDLMLLDHKIKTGFNLETSKTNNTSHYVSKNSKSQILISEPFYYAKIRLFNGQKGKISISEDDDPIKVSEEFSKVFNLESKLAEILKNTLVDQFKYYMMNLLSSQF